MTSFRQLASEGLVKKKDLYRVRLQDIQIEPGFNLRFVDSDLQDHIESIYQSILNGISIPPIEVRITEESTIVVVDGHCRFYGYQKAKESGMDVEWIDALPFKGDDAERLSRMITSGQGKPLSILEMAIGYERLIDLGWDAQKIADKHGKTKQHVEQMLLLARSSIEIRQMIQDGKVAASIAISAIKKYGEHAYKVLSAQLEGAQIIGKKKVTATSIERPLPKRVVSHVVSSVESFAASLDDNTLENIAKFRDMKPERLINKRISVDASALLDLLDAQEEVEQIRNKRRGL